jgi:small-conductance mechanosensitive channel
VPNSHFLERDVVNWSHGDPVSRLHVPVSVSYGSDMGWCALRCSRPPLAPEVLGDPRSRVELRGFGESTLDFDLLVWTAEPRNQTRVKSDLYFRIEASLREHGIEIPYPQRDINVPPELLRLATAITRRHFSADELAATERPRAAPAPHDPHARWAAFDSAGRASGTTRRSRSSSSACAAKVAFRSRIGATA